MKMPMEGRICPYCLKPVLDSSLKYYIRYRDKDAWKTGSPLASKFRQEILSCRRENHYKQFWSERLAEGKMGADLEDRLVVTKQKLEAVIGSGRGKGEGIALKRGGPAGEGGLVSDGRTLPDGRLLPDGRPIPDGKGSVLINGNLPQEPEEGGAEPDLFSGEEKEIRIEREGGQYKLFLGSVLAADTRTVCGSCWNVLPPQLYQSDMKVIHISLVAGIGAGKSCLLLSWLRSVNGSLAVSGDRIRAGLSSWPERYVFHSMMWDDMDYPKVYEEMLERFSNDNICPQKTDPVFVPPIFVEAEDKSRQQSVLLCIYDAAGEVLTHFKASSWNPVLMKHLEQTDAVIFLIDPADAGLRTKGTDSRYAWLEQELRITDTEKLFNGAVKDPGEQARIQSSPVASRTLEEILREKLAESREAGPDRRKRNTEAAFLALDNFLRHAAAASGASPRQIQEIREAFGAKLMALVVPKSDLFREYYEGAYPDVFRTYGGRTGVKRENYEKARMDMVRDFFAGFYDLETIGARFPHHREFILSALGCEARPDTIQEESTGRGYTRLEGEYCPFRIEDPVHWILDKML